MVILKKLNLNSSKIILLILIHLIGFLGIHSGYRLFFLSLSPINLLVSAFIIFFNEKIPYRLYLSLYFIFYGVEWLGVYSGWPFGTYFYAETLGIKVFQIPLIIGVNWLLLLHASQEIITKFLGSLPLKIFREGENAKIRVWEQFAAAALKASLVAALMLLIDYLIEPHAAELDYWHWFNDVIPLSNYLAWLLISFSCSLILSLAKSPRSSFSVAFSYLVILIMFFYFL
ncbi:MAG: carotenoid biosynthesis protein [Vampirovibrionia bacterium]